MFDRGLSFAAGDSGSDSCCAEVLPSCSPFGWLRLFALDPRQAWPWKHRHHTHTSSSGLPLPAEFSPREDGGLKAGRLLHFSQVPVTERIPHVLTGYRLNYPLASCARSLWALHNETLNVWTHLLGALYFLFLAVVTVQYLWQPVPMHPPSLHLPAGPLVMRDVPRHHESLGLVGGARHAYVHAFVEIPSAAAALASSATDLSAGFFDALVFALFLGGALICHVCSAVYHLYRCHSPVLHQKLFYIDVVGICCMILGSYIAGLYYGFAACHPVSAFVYSSAISTIVVIIVFSPKVRWLAYFNHTGRRRNLLICAVAMAVLPILHWLALSDTTEVEVQLYLHRMIGMMMLYGIGFLFYSSKFPERLLPGRFDIWGHSHTWWHIFVSLAAVLFHSTLMDVYVVNKRKVCLA